MKHLTRIFAISAAAALTLSGAQAQDALKIGVVDMTRVFEEYHKTKGAQEELETRKEGAREEVEKMEQPLKEVADKIKGLQASASDPAISAELRQSKAKQFESEVEKAKGLQKEIIEFARRRESQLLEMFNRRRDVLLAEISEGVKTRSVKDGYDLVFDKSARSTRGVPFLLYSKDARDFSGEIITELNASKP